MKTKTKKYRYAYLISRAEGLAGFFLSERLHKARMKLEREAYLSGDIETLRGLRDGINSVKADIDLNDGWLGGKPNGLTRD